MPFWVWIIIGIAIVVVLIVLVMAVLRSRRTASLKRRFGPEYDLAVTGSGHREGEASLRAREERRDSLDIRPLDDADRARFLAQWQEVQHAFVDQPSQAVNEASTLLTEVMERRGYPVENFEERAELISVDHPRLVQDYRAAQVIRARNAENRASTEDLRDALLRYRGLFGELLDADRSADQDAEHSAGEGAEPRVRDGGTGYE
jgi:hypothetical protein